jgi:hypothetical protein
MSALGQKQTFCDAEVMLYPRKRTLSGVARMSALGHEPALEALAQTKPRRAAGVQLKKGL